MNDLLQRIVNAIIRQEGMPLNYYNPCNLRGAPWLTNPTIEGGFWKPTSRAQGVAGGAHVLALHVAQGNTLQDFIAGHPGVYSGFAPSSDHNDPETYIKNVMAWTGITDKDVSLHTFLEESSPCQV